MTKLIESDFKQKIELYKGAYDRMVSNKKAAQDRESTNKVVETGRSRSINDLTDEQFNAMFGRD